MLSGGKGGVLNGALGQLGSSNYPTNYLASDQLRLASYQQSLLYQRQSLAWQQAYINAQSFSYHPDALRNVYTPPPRHYLPIPWMRPDALRKKKWKRKAIVAASLILGVDKLLQPWIVKWIRT